MFDLIIRGGRIVDGSGGPWFRGDVGIVADRIQTIGALARTARDGVDGEPEPLARVVVDAAGLVVAPGFVDFHSHSDVAFLADPRAESAIRQGITTQLVGNCGFSAAPVAPRDREVYRRDGLMYSHSGYEWDWSTIAEYRQRLREAHPAINVLTLVGHNTLRAAVVGQIDRRASDHELASMRRLLEQALADGAVGLSSGLTYTPGSFADSSELRYLIAALDRTGLGYHTHLRNYGHDLPAALDEALTVTADPSVPLFVSHLYPAGRDHWGTAGSVLLQLEHARARGAEVCFDVTPWPRGGGPLSQYVPAHARAGGTSALLSRLREPGERTSLAHEMESGVAGLRPRWNDELVVRVGSATHADWVGQTIAELAEMRGEPAAETALGLLAEDDGQVWVAPTSKSAADVELLLGHPLGIPVTDGITVAMDGPLGRPEMQKSYGTFPRVLGHYVRERGVVRLEEAVRKMTAEPARRLGLWDRGILRSGMCADLTVFDPARIADSGNERLGGQYPIGVEYVVVNGQVALSRGMRTTARAGRSL
jgi:N-acyl-D-amino-acid deacylase